MDVNFQSKRLGNELFIMNLVSNFKKDVMLVLNDESEKWMADGYLDMKSTPT